MKAKLVAILFLSQVFFIAACHKDVSVLNGNSDQTINGGAWRVSLFTDSGNDETGDFTGYNFTFNQDGSLTVVKNNATTTGSWNKGSKFDIDLGPKSDGNKPLGEITDDWQIISISSTEIKLEDDNAASIEFLTFSKN